MSKVQTGKILSANRLTDGEVVFLARTGNWSLAINDAVLALDEQTAENLAVIGKEAEANNQVTGAYLVDSERSSAGDIAPRHIRERIRAAGPSVRIDLYKSPDRHSAA